MKKKRYIQIEDGCVNPIILELDEAMTYTKELLEGLSTGFPLKVQVVEMTEEEYNKLPEFEG